MPNGSKTAEWHGFSTGSRPGIDRQWREPPLPTGISNSVSRARPRKTRAAADRRRCRFLAWWAWTRSTQRGSRDRGHSSESGSSSSRARKRKRGKKRSWKVSPPTLYMNAIQTHTIAQAHRVRSASSLGQQSDQNRVEMDKRVVQLHRAMMDRRRALATATKDYNLSKVRHPDREAAGLKHTLMIFHMEKAEGGRCDFS